MGVINFYVRHLITNYELERLYMTMYDNEDP